LEHRASDSVSVKNLTAIETSTIVKLLRPYVPVGTKRTRRKKVSEQGDENIWTQRRGSGRRLEKTA
jgi:hypothetical protein